MNSHLVNNAYLLSCIISGFVYFYSSRLEKWWCTVSIFKKETEVERIKKRRNFLHSSAAGFNRYVVNQSNKWNRCTRKEGNQETQQSYAQITEWCWWKYIYLASGKNNDPYRHLNRNNSYNTLTDLYDI